MKQETGRICLIDNRLRFRLITIACDEELFHVVERGMRDAAMALNVDADLVGTPGFDIEDVMRIVRSAVEDGIDGIGLNVFHPTALAGVIAEAGTAGVPVVAFNIDAAKTGSGNLSYIMQDFFAAGVVLGRRVAASVADGEHIIVAMHDDGVGALEERAAGIEAGLASRRVVVTRVITGRAPTKGAEILDQALFRLDVRAIIGTGQPDTEAAGIVARAGQKHRIYAAASICRPGSSILSPRDISTASSINSPILRAFIQSFNWLSTGGSASCRHLWTPVLRLSIAKTSSWFANSKQSIR